MNDNQHLERLVSCRNCDWAGRTGHLIASGWSPDLLCPTCSSGRIKYVIADAPAMKQ